MFQDSPSDVVAYYMVGSTLLLLLVIAIVTYAFLSQKKVLQLQQAVFNALQEGEEKERTRLAEELHDGIGAKLSGLKMNLEYLKSNTTENQELIARVFSGISETLEEVRSISHNLLPYFFQERPIEQLLADHVEHFNINNKCQCDVIVQVPDQNIGPVTKHLCFRIVAELLNNIHKHAKASLASVQVNIEERTMEIAVEDNGCGFKTDDPEIKGIGLENVRNRIKFFKGIISIDSSANGTSIIIEVPLNTRA